MFSLFKYLVKNTILENRASLGYYKTGQTEIHKIVERFMTVGRGYDLWPSGRAVVFSQGHSDFSPTIRPHHRTHNSVPTRDLR